MLGRRSTWVAAPHDAMEFSLMQAALDVIALEQAIDDIREHAAMPPLKVKVSQ